MGSLMKQNFKYVKNMLSLDIVDFLTSFSLKNFTKGGDPQVPLSSASHSSSSDIYNHVIYYLLPIMEKETELKLKPIYAYNRIYLGGSELKTHRPSSL